MCINNADLFDACSLATGWLCGLATGGFGTAGFTVGGLVGRGGAARWYTDHFETYTA